MLWMLELLGMTIDELARGPLLHTTPAAVAAHLGHILRGFKVLNFKARTHAF